MKKYQLDFYVAENRKLSDAYSMLKMKPVADIAVPDCLPGQFVEILVDDAPSTLLRRPISISDVDREANALMLLVRRAGEATAALCDAPAGKRFNMLIPLGNGFSTEDMEGKRCLLVGGGVGVAPLWMLARNLSGQGAEVCSLIGARTAGLLLLSLELKKEGRLAVSTDDGSRGEPGVVTSNSVWNEPWDMVYVCGPAPMMKAVAALCREKNLPCEVSLENMMACGLGACLCCVENTVKGNVCVCTEGPVFNIKDLNW